MKSYLILALRVQAIRQSQPWDIAYSAGGRVGFPTWG